LLSSGVPNASAEPQRDFGRAAPRIPGHNLMQMWHLARFEAQEDREATVTKLFLRVNETMGHFFVTKAA